MAKSTPDRAETGVRALSRRNFLVLGAAAAIVTSTPRPVQALAARPKSLSLVNLHTHEEFDSVYWSDGRHLSSALEQLNEVLRDHRTDDVHPIDRKLLDVLYELHARVGRSEPLHVISGYRSPATNAKLRARSSRVARKSYHMRGMAVDVRLPGIATSTLRNVARDMNVGGVGYYPRSRFVHIDTGPVRSWNG